MTKMLTFVMTAERTTLISDARERIWFEPLHISPTRKNKTQYVEFSLPVCFCLLMGAHQSLVCDFREHWIVENCKLVKAEDSEEE